VYGEVSRAFASTKNGGNNYYKIAQRNVHSHEQNQFEQKAQESTGFHPD